MFFSRRVRSSYKADERAKSVHGVHVAAASGRRHRHRHLVHAWVNSLAGLEQYRRDRERERLEERRRASREIRMRSSCKRKTASIARQRGAKGGKEGQRGAKGGKGGPRERKTLDARRTDSTESPSFFAAFVLSSILFPPKMDRQFWYHLPTPCL